MVPIACRDLPTLDAATVVRPLSGRIHSLLSNKCAAMPSKVHGQGVYAIAPIATGEIVAVWGGTVFSAEDVTRLATVLPHFASHPVSVCDGYYFGSANLFEFDDAERMNHSCEPNCGVKGQIVVVARRAIECGEELTFDYDTTESDAEPFDCHCGSVRCRQTISGSAWHDPEFISHNREFMSWYLLEKAAMNKEESSREIQP